MPRPFPALSTFAAYLTLVTLAHAQSPTTLPAPTLQLLQDTIVDPKILTMEGPYGAAINGLSFQQFPLATLNGYQYVTYYDPDRHVSIARRALPEGKWQIIRFSDYTFKRDDAHNVVVLGICPKDGTIHLAFDHHIDPLHYRVSRPGAALNPASVEWTADLFSPITSTLDEPLDHVTYPQFVITPEGNLQLFYRHGTSGAGDRWMIDYEAATSTTPARWHDRRQIDTGTGTYQDALGKSTSRNGYENGYTYGPDGKLHSTWCWRESANHDIAYAWSDDQGRSWKNNAGDIVRPLDGSRMISVESPGITAVPIDRTHSLMNQETQAVDSKGRIHCVMWHRRDDAAYNNKPWTPALSAYYHYFRDDTGSWQRTLVSNNVGNRPKMFFDQHDNAYLVFITNRDPTTWQSDLYFLDGELQIATATPASHWTDWKVVYTAPGHYMNEPLIDLPRLKSESILSIFLQETPTSPRQPTPLHILDLKLPS